MIIIGAGIQLGTGKSIFIRLDLFIGRVKCCQHDPGIQIDNCRLFLLSFSIQ